MQNIFGEKIWAEIWVQELQEFDSLVGIRGIEAASSLVSEASMQSDNISGTPMQMNDGEGNEDQMALNDNMAESSMNLSTDESTATPQIGGMMADDDQSKLQALVSGESEGMADMKMR